MKLRGLVAGAAFSSSFSFYSILQEGEKVAVYLHLSSFLPPFLSCISIRAKRERAKTRFNIQKDAWLRSEFLARVLVYRRAFFSYYSFSFFFFFSHCWILW